MAERFDNSLTAVLEKIEPADDSGKMSIAAVYFIVSKVLGGEESLVIRQIARMSVKNHV